jgi:hypothetical protein
LAFLGHFLEQYQIGFWSSTKKRNGLVDLLAFYQLRVVTYDYASIARRIEEAIAALPEAERARKVFLPKIAITDDQWSRKINLEAARPGRFTYEEITRIANFLQAPLGWPFMEWSQADALKRALEALETSRRPSRRHPRGASPAGQPEKRQRVAQKGRPK